MSQPRADGAEAVLRRVFEQERGRVLAALLNRIRDFDLAEDALQDALADAAVAWPRDGPPRNAGAWLLAVARRRAIDRIRKAAVRADPGKLRQLVDARSVEGWEPDLDEAIPDERLRLIFTCCHPALPGESQVALTLRALCGLSTREIARAFLVSEQTMAQRLVRAKQKIRDKGVPYRVPEKRDLDYRLDSVLDVIYLIFNEGYAATHGQRQVRMDLCQEAIRLSRIVHELLPDPEVDGLLALLLLHDARRPARVDAAGELVPLDAQDRTRWLREQSQEGRALLLRALGGRSPGRFQIQAAISALHSEAANAEATDWKQIAGLYEALERVEPSPVVTLNRAVALSRAGDAEAAAELLESVAPPLASYQPFFVARADLWARRGESAAASAALRTAIGLTTNQAELRFLERKLEELSG